MNKLRSHEHPAGACRHCGKEIVLTDTPQTGPYYWHRGTQSVYCDQSGAIRAEPR